jgi:hypothetical protein
MRDRGGRPCRLARAWSIGLASRIARIWCFVMNLRMRLIAPDAARWPARRR